MPEGVKCSVSNCAFWDTGNQCGAPMINIDIDQHAGADYTAEFAQEPIAVSHKDTASKSSSTCCHTFKPKQKQA
ncbi:DUF1540 domain-containing protein [Marinicrinis sediminis]